MLFQYHLPGDKAGTIRARSGLQAARKLIGKHAAHTCGDAATDMAVYQGRYFDNDDYEQCTLRQIAEDPNYIPRPLIVGTTMFATVSAGIIGFIAYDMELFRNTVYSLIGHF
jgi:hypothetical protein